MCRAEQEVLRVFNRDGKTFDNAFLESSFRNKENFKMYFKNLVEQGKIAPFNKKAPMFDGSTPELLTHYKLAA